MTKTKMGYEAPSFTCLEVRYEVNIMSGQIQANGTETGNVLDPSTYGFDNWD